jgi:hypothetical protein
MLIRSACLVLLPVAFPAAARADEAADGLARLIHKAVVAKLPPVIEDKSGWGRTVPLPERVRFPRLRRTVVQVGDHMEVPDGPWRQLRLRVEDPDRDLRVRVRDFRRLGPTTYRVVVDTDVALRTEADIQRWRNGVELADLTARADVALNVRLECDVSARLDAGRVPPRLLLVPEVQDLKLNLRQFTPRQVTFRRAGVTIAGEGVEAAGEEVKDSLQAMLRAAEPDLKKRAGEGLARALKEGKDPLTAAELLRAVGPLLRQKE